MTDTPTVGSVLEHEAQIAALPVGSVLLCTVNEVFWLAPMANDERTWFAPGYDPAVYSWDDPGVASWAPLTVLHIGTPPDATAALAAVGEQVRQ